MLSFLPLHLSAFAQRDSIPLTTIIDKTSKFTNGRPVEKVYLHFDKPYYSINDTIWYKAYVTVDLHQPSNLSKILYVDITDDQNTIVSEQKLYLVNGTANCYLSLPSLYVKRGNYHIRAYTKWMRNTDQSYFFNKTITVGSTDANQVISKIVFKNSITEKLAKINAQVAYKDQDGNPYGNRKVNWRVLNDDGTISKGKGETDKNGILNVSFSSEKPAELNSSTISTDLQLDDRRVITRTFTIETTAPALMSSFSLKGVHL